MASQQTLRINHSAVKRSLDFVLAIAGLIVLLPLLIMIGIAIRLDSPGPILFRQRRYGYGGATFQILKFRSMTTEASCAEFIQARQEDPRVTRSGRFLRRTNLDELPQLLNVIVGDMSLVGPRPHAVPHDDQFARILPRLMGRYAVRPGITGWAQVNGLRGETTTLSHMAIRLEHDLWYVENWSPVLDVEILFKTLFHPSARRNAY